MIHVDVKRDTDRKYVRIQTSTDGGPWKDQYIIALPTDARDQTHIVESDACHTARVFVNGCRYAGAEVRSTAFGYNN